MSAPMPQPGEPANPFAAGPQGPPQPVVTTVAIALGAVTAIAAVAWIVVAVATALPLRAHELMPIVFMSVALGIAQLAALVLAWLGRARGRLLFAAFVGAMTLLHLVVGAGAGWLGVVPAVLLFLPPSRGWFAARARGARVD